MQRLNGIMLCCIPVDHTEKKKKFPFYDLSRHCMAGTQLDQSARECPTTE